MRSPQKRGLEFHAVSSASGEGIVELVRAMADALDRIPKPSVPVESEVQPMASRERDAEEARAAVAGLDDDDSALPHAGEVVEPSRCSQGARARASPFGRAFWRHV